MYCQLLGVTELACEIRIYGLRNSFFTPVPDLIFIHSLSTMTHSASYECAIQDPRVSHRGSKECWLIVRSRAISWAGKSHAFQWSWRARPCIRRAFLAALTFCTITWKKITRNHTGRAYPMRVYLRLLFAAGAISTSISLPVSQYSEWHGFRNLGRLRYTILGCDNKSNIIL